MNNRKVTKEEFDAFIAAYKGPLEQSQLTITDPPKRLFEDFSIGTGYDAVVAFIDRESWMQRGEEDEYYIREK